MDTNKVFAATRGSSPTTFTGRRVAASIGVGSPPVLTADELTMYYAQVNGVDVFVSTRDSKTQPFGTGVPVADVSSTVADQPAALSHDGCVLYISSARPGGLGGRDIWQSVRPRIGSALMAEVIGESFEADVPLITLTGMPAVPGMVKTGFSSVGIRGRFNTRPVIWASRQLTQDCVELAISGATVARSSLASILEDQASPVSRDPRCRDDLKALTRTTSHSFMLRLRLVRRGGSNEGVTNLGGVQWAAGGRYDSEAASDTKISWSGSLGVSGMHLNQSDVVADGVTTRYIRLNDVRVTASFEARKAATKEAVTSAAGVYAAFSQDFWTNKFHIGGANKVRDYQLEGGVYLSGVMNGFSGMIMLSIIKPYAPEAEYLYAVSVIPFGGGVPQNGAR